jgi:cobalt-zinc-cadmium efflux system membrane fusion protein
MKYLSFIILSAFLLSCKQEKTTAENPETSSSHAGNELTLSDEQMKTVDFAHISLEKKRLSGTLQINGKVGIDPNYKISLSSALGGRIQNVNALSGEFVKKGQTIVTLEDNQFIQLQQDYLTTKAQLLSAEPNYIRQKELNRSKSTSDKVMQQAETDYRSLLAVRSGLEEKLRLININPGTLTPSTISRNIHISAPFNGWVSEVFVNKGKYASPSDVLVELINPEGLLLNLKVFEKDLPQIKIGQLLQAYTNGNPDEKAEAKIISKGNHINDDGTAELIAQVINPKSVELMAGLYVNAVIAIDNMEVYTVPSDAVVSFEGKNYVFEQISTNKFRLIKVEIGKSFENATEIVNYQILSDKKIVSKGAYTLLMALKNSPEE